MTNSFHLSKKYIDFINSVKNVSADFLEGTTASGKTTVGAGVKFMRMVSASAKKLHIIAAKTTGVAEKNIIQQDNGILDLHRNAVYYGNGDKDNKLPHIKFEGKIIYVLGYDNRDKWELVLGSQFGCVYIDEINTANIEFVREISTRNDYLMATLNPDDPSLPVYKEFIVLRIMNNVELISIIRQKADWKAMIVLNVIIEVILPVCMKIMDITKWLCVHAVV